VFPGVCNMSHCSHLQFSIKLSLNALLGTSHLCWGCTFSHIKEDLSPKWVLTALIFKTSELNLGFKLLAVEFFRRRKGELERYECGDPGHYLWLTCGSERIWPLPWNFSEKQLSQNILRLLQS
jgi:hypothetical protein